jgi:transcriptional regulator with GAF, ATPase, and Fis domain
MMNRHFEKPETRRKTASPKSRNKSKIQQRSSRKLTGAKALEEARRQQSALAEVLSAISSSKFELQPVLDRVVRTAARLCRARQALIFRFEDGVYRFAAGYSINPAYSEIERRSQISPGPGTLVGRAAMARRAVRIDDAWADPLYERKEDAKVGRHRSMLGVPLLRDGEPIGVIGPSRSRVDPFSAREIELITTFANQAVIAIENVRLLEAEQQRTRELTEALEQQTAAAEVLQAISRSQGELEPVFATMLEKAVRICGATFEQEPRSPPVRRTNCWMNGYLSYLVNELERPFTDAGFGNWFLERCIEAGVPGRAHGLREAGATIAANNGATAHHS